MKGTSLWSQTDLMWSESFCYLGNNLFNRSLSSLNIGVSPDLLPQSHLQHTPHLQVFWNCFNFTICYFAARADLTFICAHHAIYLFFSSLFGKLVKILAPSYCWPSMAVDNRRSIFNGLAIIMINHSMYQNLQHWLVRKLQAHPAKKLASIYIIKLCLQNLSIHLIWDLSVQSLLLAVHFQYNQ